MALISNWSNFPEVEANCFGFSSLSKIKQTLETTDEIIARGNGRCYGDASLNKNILSGLNLNKFLFFDKINGIIEVQAGVLLDDILKVIVPCGWFLPVTPGTKFITIAGAAASDVHGKNHHVDGAFSHHIINIDIMLADGQVISCSSSNNADLFWATCGGMGLTGIILTVKFSLKPIQSSFINQTTIRAGSLNEILDLFEKNNNATYSVAWIDCLKGGKNFGRSLLMLGEHYTNDNEKVILKSPYKIHANPTLSIPFNFPGFALNKYSIKLFNTAYYHKAITKIKQTVGHYDGFFYPLDAILSWNRMYGKQGFAQYQFVVPMEARKGLEIILKKIQEKGMGSFLAVLKVFGEQNDLISFPMKGYTLALDFAINDKLFPFLDELDRIVLDYGGRIYMTKDSRMNKEIFWKGYPKASEFVNIVKKYNPHGKINSMLSKRLEIL
ncbi:MAG: FAD-binding oxidoreductase [Cyclobacteriaceae bacterium]|nr:FAD-binding oxidoreductase [Cyclobacteriaceae bacterium]